MSQGQGEKVYRTELTPVSFLERSAYAYPDRTAVVHGSRRFTYREFHERVNRLGSALRAAGEPCSGRVGLEVTAFSPPEAQREALAATVAGCIDELLEGARAR